MLLGTLPERDPETPPTNYDNDANGKNTTGRLRLLRSSSGSLDIIIIAVSGPLPGIFYQDMHSSIKSYCHSGTARVVFSHSIPPFPHSISIVAFHVLDPLIA